MDLTFLYCSILNLTGRDKGGYYHELFLRSKRFLSHRIQRIKIKGTGSRKPSSPETEPNFYNASFLPYTSIPIKHTQVSMASNMLASGPNMYAETGGSMSLHQLLTFPTFRASLQHQAQFALRSNGNILMEAQYKAQAQAQLQQQLRMAPLLYPDMQMASGFGHHHTIPMVSGAQHFPSAASMALAFSHVEQDQAALARLDR
jgi:hypothetical protein